MALEIQVLTQKCGVVSTEKFWRVTVSTALYDML
jgi:hypothetical protein